MSHKHDERCYMHDHTLEQYMDRVMRDIDRTGLHITGVMAHPTLCYTTGLFPEHGYELLTSGLPFESAMVILNDIKDSLQTTPLQLDVPDDRFTNMPIVFKACGPLAQTDNGVSRRFYMRDHVPMVQMVLCDRQGRFPWEAGYDHRYMRPRQLHYWEMLQGDAALQQNQ